MRLKFVLVVLTLASGCRSRSISPSNPFPKAAERNPNIILILADDLGYGDLGSYGNEVNRTPHLDRLAAEGLRFTDFHSNGPMCTPTRASLLTGMYQNRFGEAFETAISARSDRERGLPHEVETLAEALRDAGYRTAMYRKWHLGYESPNLPTSHGFESFRGLVSGDGDHHSHINRSGEKDWWHDDRIQLEDGYTADLITDHSIEFLKRGQERPSFIYASHLTIHFPWQGPEEEGYRVEGGDYWNLTKLGPHGPGEVGPVVKKMVESLDQSVGKIIAAVRALGDRRETFVFFASDNGGYLHYGGRFRGEISDNGPLRGQKTDLWEGGHRVPAIAWWPGRIEAGRVTHETALTMDLMPTILEVAGVAHRPASQDRDGISLTDLLFYEKTLPDRTVFWRAGDEKAARLGPWKLVHREDSTMLFNLDRDLGEQVDIADRYPNQVEQLALELAEWERDVDGSYNTWRCAGQDGGRC